jgi:glycosyltransferase involved in cell wall biosynthesis
MPGVIRSVALNALFLDPGRSGGPETYLRQLAPALIERYPGVTFTIVTTRAGKAALQEEQWADGAELVALRADEGQRLRRTLAEQVVLPALARRRRFDLVHSLASVAPVRLPVASVVTLHDVTFFKVATFNPVTTFGMRRIVASAGRRADGLIAVSAAARDNICSVLGLPPERFAVVPHGAGRLPAVEPTAEEELRVRYGLKDARVVLCVGAKRPHKNQELLVRATPLLPEDVTVVLAGHAEPYQDRLAALVSEFGLEGRVKLPDYVPLADLEGLWRLAACAAFPTMAEGFGLPVLEAMQRGVPVACSDIAVLHEVGGDVPRYFPADNPAAAAGAIVAAMDDPSLPDAGRRRAAGFSWSAAADGTYAAYERALARRCGR